jgi:hypothetical protein
MADPIDDLLQMPVFAAAPPPGPFVRAAAACHALLVRRFPAYADFLRHRGLDPDMPLTSLDDVRALPALLLPVLKTYTFTPAEDFPITVRLTSSGTTGAPSVTPLDEPGMCRRVAAMLAAYRGLDVVAGPMEALAFLLDPATTQMAGSVVIDAALRAAPEIRSVRYLARMGPAGPSFAAAEAAAALTAAAARGPVLLVGYPALLAVAVQQLAAAGTRLPLPAGSRLLTGGGWKAFLPGVNLNRDEFQQQMSHFFQLPAGAVRDMFGLSECPAVFVQCQHGSYHVPAFAWAQAIDPETGRDVLEGAVGLLHLTVPLTTSYPLLKILTTDKVKLTRGCPCGREAPCLVPCGRATAARFETCAMKIGRALAG